jgi:hypothetical protein
MSNVILVSLLEDQRAEAELQSVGIEGFTHLFDYLSEVGNLLSGHFAGILKKLEPINAGSAFSRNLVKLMGEIPYDVVSKITVYHPVGLSEYMVPFIVHMNRSLEMLDKIDERLYTPLSTYMGELLSQPDSADKLWVARDLKPVDIESAKATFESFFDPRIKARSTTLTAPFEKLYRTNSDFLEAGKQLKLLIERINGIDFNRIRKAEKTLSDRIKAYADYVQKNEDAAIRNKQSLRKLADTVRSIANETEYFALMVYTAKTVQVAVSDSAERLEKALK